MSLLKTISFLRQQPKKTKIIRSVEPKEKKTKNKKQDIKDKKTKKNQFSKLNEDALRRQKDSKSTIITLYWDKIFFNNEIEETAWLSNECLDYPFEENGIDYKSRLHYFYSAAVLSKEHKKMIRETQDLDKLESLYKKADKRPEWDSLNYRKKVMRAACENQIAQNVILMRRIKKTGDYVDFVYLNPNDGFFGTGKNGRGFNHLGKILQECRALLTDKENNGFVILFSENEWVHPDTKFSGMIESAKKYISNNFSYTNQDDVNSFLNPPMAGKEQNEAIELMNMIKNINSGLGSDYINTDNPQKFEKEISAKTPSRKIKINLKPTIDKYLENQRDRQR